MNTEHRFIVNYNIITQLYQTIATLTSAIVRFYEALEKLTNNVFNHILLTLVNKNILIANDI